MCNTFFAVTFVTLATGASAGPFLTRDQNPFTQVYGQPLPAPARLPQAGAFDYALSLDITNTLNEESGVNESLYVDFEAYNLTLGGIYGLSPRWALKLDIPFIHRSYGVFDHAIDEWHKFFSLPRSSRPAVQDNQFKLFYSNNRATGIDKLIYSNNGATGIDMNTPQAGIGDAQLGLGHSLHQTPEHALSLWAAIDLPVGDAGDLTGNDDLDYSFWLAGSSIFGAMTTLDTNIGVVLPGDSVLTGLETEDLVFFGHAGAHYALNPALALKLQLAGHTGYYKDTDLDFLGSVVIIIFGVSINAGSCSAIDLGFSEDIKAGASPDIGLLISWKSQLEC